MIAHRVGPNVSRERALMLCLPRHCNASLPTLRVGFSALFFSNKAQKASHEEQIAIIGQQRLRRPIAPHLSVYNKKQTWFGTSAWMRVTGLAVGGVAYTYFAAYAAGSLFGWHFESQSVVGAFAALAPGTKSVIKFGLAFPFTFHFFNGIKQLMYDMVIGFGRRNIDRGQAIVWASGFVGALLLTFGL